MKTLAVLMTVHNRRENTLRCLRALETQLPAEGVRVDIYMTDDASTDGTPQAVGAEFPDVRILPGDGSLYWNGGMRRAWQEASREDYNYYLWLNDDTKLFPDALEGLLSDAHTTGDGTIICGATHSAQTGLITYGGRRNGRLMAPDGTLQKCDTFNGNVVLVPRAVFWQLGMLDARFTHALGDFDYGLRAGRAGIAIRQACGWAGTCEKHDSLPRWCDPRTPLRERIRWFGTPLGGRPAEQFYFERRHFGVTQAAFHFATIHLRLLFPQLWASKNNPTSRQASDGKCRALVFYQYLPPWRIDIFNEMGRFYDLTIAFTDAKREGFTYDRDALLGRLHGIRTLFLEKGFRIGTRPVRFGIAMLLRECAPKIVFSHEYSVTSFVLALHKKRGRKQSIGFAEGEPAGRSSARRRPAITRCFIADHREPRPETGAYGQIGFRYYITTSDNVAMAQACRGLKAAVRRFILRRADGIVVYSQSVKAWYEKRFPELDVRICPNIQNPESLQTYRTAFPAIIARNNEKFGIKGAHIILYVGRLTQVKGLELLLRAYAASVYREYKLVLAGNGAEREKLKMLAAALGIEECVVFAGYSDGAELYAWYDRADFLVLPSLHEPFGAVVNEALVFGCPVVASNRIGALDYIDEQNGIVFDPSDCEGFVAALNTAAERFRNFNPQKQNLMRMSFEKYVRNLKIPCE